LDVGTFIIETNKVRWTDDLGADRYSLPGFWDYSPVTGQRWKYFRDTNFSHNTLSIDGHLQYSDGRGNILRYNKDSKKPFGIIDMTTAYKGLASKVQRGFKLLTDDLMLIQDEVNLTSGAEQIEWSSITGADVKTSGNTAVLQKDGVKMYVKIITPVNATFITAAAKPYFADEYPISGYTLLKVAVFPAGGSDQTIRIIMSSDQNAINDTNLVGSLQPLSKW
jgi:oligo-alginate lyase